MNTNRLRPLMLALMGVLCFIAILSLGTPSSPAAQAAQPGGPALAAALPFNRLELPAAPQALDVPVETRGITLEWERIMGGTLDGVYYENLYWGGLSTSFPNLVDIDADDDLDLFVSGNNRRRDNPGELRFYRNDGDAAAPDWTFVTDQYLPDHNGAQVRFVDLDGDGDYDCVALLSDRFVAYQNTGSASDPVWQEGGFNEIPHPGNWNAVSLNFADIDADADFDLFIVRSGDLYSDYTYLEFVENVGDANTPAWADPIAPYENITGKGMPWNPPEPGFDLLTFANTAFADIDADGDLDLFLSGPLHISLMRNDGTAQEPVWTFVTNDYAGIHYGNGYMHYNLAFGDLDNDADLDLLIGHEGGWLTHFKNTGTTSTANFVQWQNPLFPMEYGIQANPALGDLDNDGDLDLLLGAPDNWAAEQYGQGVVYLRNDGSPALPAWTFVSGAYQDITCGGGEMFPALVDIDDDGDLDLFLGSRAFFNNHDSYLCFYENIGTPTTPNFQFVTDTYLGISLPYGDYYDTIIQPAFGDLDGDGDYDLFIGSIGYYRNEGTPTTPNFVYDPDPPFTLDGLYFTFGDLDGDGDLDVVTDQQIYFNDTGIPDPPPNFYSYPFGKGLDYSGGPPSLGDLDGDGDLDLLQGGNGGLHYYTNAGDFCSNVTEIPAPECDNLLFFWFSTDGPNWHNHTGWWETYTPCSWYGVNCTAGHVTDLWLDSNNLNGDTTNGGLQGLTTLSQLKTLDLFNNALYGPIPPEWGSMVNLQRLNLWNNQFNGQIPVELGSLASIQILNLGHNQLQGAIPSELGGLDTLVLLWLSDNQLDSEIPADLGYNLPNLESLGLNNNQLSGTLPLSFRYLSSLQVLELQNNQLTGPIDSSFSMGPIALDTLNFANTGMCQNLIGIDPALDAWYASITDLTTTGLACSGGYEIGGRVTYQPDLLRAAGEYTPPLVHVTGDNRQVSLAPDSGGYYGVYMLPGSYTVQPDMPGYDFTPTHYNITLPPNTYSLNFTYSARGGWLDEIYFVTEGDQNITVDRIIAGQIDLAAQAWYHADLDVFQKAQDNHLGWFESRYFFDDLTMNPYGPVFNNGKFNPFAIREIRESMNRLVDRDQIVNQIFGGLAVPRWTTFNTGFPDDLRYRDLIAPLETTYAYNLAQAQADISTAMLANGAVLSNSVWHYAGEPITLTFLIRVEDKRTDIGNYIADQLEQIGFPVDRQYKTSGEASQLWVGGNVADGEWHLYTGGWVTTDVIRDLAVNFAFFHSPSGWPGVSLWENYSVPTDLMEVYTRLEQRDYADMAERRNLVAQALEGSLYWSNRLFIHDESTITYYNPEVSFFPNLVSSVINNALLPYTLRWAGYPGGSMTLGVQWVSDGAWNPVAGDNSSYTTLVRRFTTDPALLAHPQTGLMLPQRVESAEVVVVDGLPVTRTLDWVNLSFAPVITVPVDAWVDWDAASQDWVTANEKYPGGLTAAVKSVVHYPADLFDTVKWHDGSPLSAADFVMAMILPFERLDPASALYDPNYFTNLKDSFRGYRIVSTSPLVIESYWDEFQLDAENNVRSLWPDYGFGEAPWHLMAVAAQAEANGRAAFSEGKAASLGAPWLNFVGGPSLSILADELSSAWVGYYVPYPNVLNAFVDSGEADERYSNLSNWYNSVGHFWVGAGPYTLTYFDPYSETPSHLTRSPYHPDPAGKWSEPPPVEEMPYILLHQDFFNNYYSYLSTLHVQNPTAESTLLVLEFYDPSTSTTYSEQFFLPAHGLFTGTPNSFPDLPEGKTFTLRIGADQPIVSQVNTNSGTYTSLFASMGVPTGGLPREVVNTLLFPAMKGDVESSISLWNPGVSSADVVLTFYDQNGLQIHVENRSLPPEGRYSIPLTTIPQIPTGFIGTVWVSANNWAEASLMDAFASGHEQEYFSPASSTTIQFLPRAMKAFYEGGGTRTTKLYLVNQGTVNAFPTLVFYDENGTVVADWGFMNLAPGRIWIVDLAGIGQNSTTGNVYSVRATSDQPFALGELTRYDALGNDQAYAFEAVFHQVGSNHNIPRVSRQTGDYSVIQIQNTSSSQAAVTLTLYDVEGEVADTLNLNLPARGSYRWDASQVASLGDAFLGTATIAATQQVAVQVDEYQLAPDNLPVLEIGKTAPAKVASGALITYTLTVSNTSAFIASGLVITDILPVGTTYVSGGSFAGNEVSFTHPTLAAYGSAAFQFVVTATQTITNSQYAVESSEGVRATGANPVVTTITAEFCDLVTDIPKTECKALEALYNTTDGDNWSTNTDWLSTITPCTWYAVTCENGHVTGLDLTNNNLKGTIPIEITGLTQLRNLNFYFNQLSGPIPPELGSLAKLTYLSLAWNTLTGPIPPELGGLPELATLHLWINNLTGTIPTELSNLPKLYDLVLSSNQLTGAIPPELGAMTELTRLALDGNQLSGPIPAELANIPDLGILDLSNNHLNGSIPPGLGGLQELWYLKLSRNALSGVIPTELSNLPRIRHLYLTHNQFSGPIPASFAQLSTITDLDLGYNMFWADDLNLLAFLTTKDPDWAQTQTVPPTGLHAAVVSGQANAMFGEVNRAGDVNGDGYDDVLVAASGYANNAGRVFLYLGSPNGISATPVMTYTGENPGDYMNTASAAGDINNDGYDDVVISARHFDSSRGKVYVYYGSPAGLAQTPALTLLGESQGDYFGHTISTAGDVNGDGYADVVIGAPLYASGVGRAYVYHGGPGGLAASPAFVATGTTGSIPSRNSRMGYSVASAGDVNGDGYDDIIVGAQYFSTVHQEGRAYVYLGSAGGLNTAPAWFVTGENSMSYLGYTVSGAGDVNNDGYDDVLVAAIGYPSNLRQGKVYLYLGGSAGLASVPNRTYLGVRNYDYLGVGLAGVGDINGDGYADILMGATGFENGQTDEGAAYLVLGSSTGGSPTWSWTAESNQASASFGRPVAPAGDVNDDGYADVLVGAIYYDNGPQDGGRAYAWYGSAAGLPTNPSWMAETGYLSMHWTPILYTADGGYYEISYATSLAGPYTVYGVTADKLVDTAILTGLPPDVFYLRLRTFTPAHGDQQNDLWSEYSTLLAYSTLSISGKKFNDLNENTLWDAGEPALAGWTIYLDLNNNAAQDAGEPAAVTSADGSYLFSNLQPGLYTVREVLQPNWKQTFPAGPGFAHSVSIATGQVAVGRDFGNVLLPPPTEPPVVFSISPESGYNDAATAVAILGDNFESGAAVALVGPASLRSAAAIYPLDVSLVTFNQIQASVPAGLPVGLYDLQVTNPGQLSYTLVQAYTVNERIAPTVTRISPLTGPTDRAITLDIYGENFSSLLTVTLKTPPGQSPANEIVLGNILYDTSTHIKATVPKDIPVGKYILTVTNLGGLVDMDPGGVEDDFYDALQVILSDDLFINPEELRLSPHTVREGISPDIQVTIRRRDGAFDMLDVGLFFFVTDDATAQTIFQQVVVIPSIPPNGIVTQSVAWPNPVPGSYTAWAVVDFGNDYDEADELNNLTSLKLTVLPPAADATPPIVTAFSINSGADTTTSRQVTLNTTATDPAGPVGETTSGIAYLKFLEFIYDANTEDFREIARSDWLPYGEVSANYPWRIQPEPGLRYMQVWASDAAGNVSAQPMEAFINLLVTLPQLLEGQAHVYRFSMAAGQRITVTLVSLGGMADLYVWSPDWLPGEEPLITDWTNANQKSLAFDALVTGAYQVEIEAFSSTFYQLKIERGPALRVLPNQDVLVDEVREPNRGRLLPLINVSSTPSNYQGLETPPVQPELRIFLPLVVR